MLELQFLASEINFTRIIGRFESNSVFLDARYRRLLETNGGRDAKARSTTRTRSPEGGEKACYAARCATGRGRRRRYSRSVISAQEKGPVKRKLANN